MKENRIAEQVMDLFGFANSLIAAYVCYSHSGSNLCPAAIHHQSRCLLFGELMTLQSGVEEKTTYIQYMWHVLSVSSLYTDQL